MTPDTQLSIRDQSSIWVEPSTFPKSARLQMSLDKCYGVMGWSHITALTWLNVVYDERSST